ncbi:flagellar protein FlaG [Rummeliibacillus sp. NPDC094406]|uniref:flagellar protein FlaG n=1 Tax=Rummeliibacillus sp. NPDC094406 TaxID=3364511 RepID=UPI0037F1E612
MKIVSENTFESSKTLQASTIPKANSIVESSKTLASNLQPYDMTDENGYPTEQAYQTAVNKLNEFMEYSQRDSKFVFHEELGRYYVEIVNAKTKEVVKEIPPKELLDAYYEMQKLVGKMFDKQA